MDSINNFKFQNPNLKSFSVSRKNDSLKIENLKLLVDSTQEFSKNSDLKTTIQLPQLKKFNTDFNFEKFDVQTKTFSDSIPKKGIFGRLKDAFAGKENVRKDSTIVTIKSGKAAKSTKIKTELDSIITSANNHYLKEVQKIRVSVTKYKDNSGDFYHTFNSLLVYSNKLMNIYDEAIKGSKSELEKEYKAQNSKNNRIREYLVLGLMVLMFIVSILIMYFTRIAFIYESKLKVANKQIGENLKTEF